MKGGVCLFLVCWSLGGVEQHQNFELSGPSLQIPAVWIIKELGSLIGVCMEAKTTLLRFMNST